MAQTTVDFGTDLDWGDDLDAASRMVSGFDLLAQAALHRLSCPRGACLDAPDDGLDLTELLHHGMTPAEIAAIPGRVAQELTNDERFLSADVVLKLLPQSFQLSIKIETSAGPFRLVLGVADASVVLLSVSAGGA